jgi:hypothetical protein
MKFKMAIGDPSGDGHKEHASFVIDTDAESIDEVNAAYKTAKQISGVDLIEEVCREYEEHYIIKEYIDKLEAVGIKVSDLGEEAPYQGPEDAVGFFPDSWCQLVLEFLKLGNPKYHYYIVTSDEMPTFDGGGYGLFPS